MRQKTDNHLNGGIKEMMTMNDPYKILGVKETDSDEEIKRAYRNLLKVSS